MVGSDSFGWMPTDGLPLLAVRRMTTFLIACMTAASSAGTFSPLRNRPWCSTYKLTHSMCSYAHSGHPRWPPMCACSAQCCVHGAHACAALADSSAAPVQNTDGVCIGQWNKRWCNHWVSMDALKKHILEMAEQGHYTFACPVCWAERCNRCGNHDVLGSGSLPCCALPPRQVRALLTDQEMAQCVPQSELAA
jgi:hypothetical protein